MLDIFDGRAKIRVFDDFIWRIGDLYNLLKGMYM